MIKPLYFYLLLLPNIAYSAPLIISADRVLSERDTTSNSVISFTEEEIREFRGSFLWELIDHVPGVNISNSGGQGQTTTVFIRGAESRHTLVLFEGIELNDSSSTGNLADLSNLSISSASTVEVLPGSQSVLYGPDAIGGVIRSDILNLEKIKRPHFEYDASYGSNSSHSLGVTHYNKVNKTSYLLNVIQKESAGISQTSVNHDPSREDDGFSLNSVTGKVLYKISNKHQVSFLSQFSSSKTDLDKGFGANRDDTNYTTKDRHYLLKLESKSLVFSGFWEPIFSYSRVANKRSDVDDVDSLSSSISTFDSRFSRQKFSNQNNFHLTKTDTIITGIEYEVEEAQTQSLNFGSLSGLSQVSETNQSLYFLHKRADTIFWSTGFRVHNFSDSTEFTYKIAPGLKFSGGRTWVSFSTGFKNPSLYQRNSSSFGNKSLLPEESKSLELGVELKLSQYYSLELTFFHLDIDNLIDTTGTFPNITYINLRKAKSTGIAASLKTKYGGFDFTRQNTQDSNGYELINRPKLNANIYGRYHFLDYRFTLKASYRGKRDSGFSSSRTRLGGYTLLNSKLTYEYRKALLLWFSVNNLLDRSYTDISNLNSDGRNYTIGLNWRY